MAMELGPRPVSELGHICRIPRPFDAEVAEGHLCECGKRWSYQPAHWEMQPTLEDLVRRQQAAALLRGIIPSFQPEPHNSHDMGIIVPIDRAGRGRSRKRTTKP